MPRRVRGSATSSSPSWQRTDAHASSCGLASSNAARYRAKTRGQRIIIHGVQDPGGEPGQLEHTAIGHRPRLDPPQQVGQTSAEPLDVGEIDDEMARPRVEQTTKVGGQRVHSSAVDLPAERSCRVLVASLRRSDHHRPVRLGTRALSVATTARVILVDMVSTGPGTGLENFNLGSAKSRRGIGTAGATPLCTAAGPSSPMRGSRSPTLSLQPEVHEAASYG